jgi:hypothetical protein
MIAAVAYWELRLAGRRRRQHVLRWCYLGWLTLQLMSWITQGPIPRARPPLAVRLVDDVLILQCFLIALLTPALTAAIVTDANARGVLPQLVTTDLWPSDILLGKLLARLAEVALLLLTGLPVLAGLGVFAGLGPVLMLMLVWLPVPPLLGLGAAGLLASVLARTTRDAVVGIYLAGLMLAAIVWQIWPGLGASLSPLEVLRPALERSLYQASAGRLLVYSLGWLLLGSRLPGRRPPALSARLAKAVRAAAGCRTGRDPAPGR